MSEINSVPKIKVTNATCESVNEKVPFTNLKPNYNEMDVATVVKETICKHHNAKKHTNATCILDFDEDNSMLVYVPTGSHVISLKSINNVMSMFENRLSTEYKSNLCYGHILVQYVISLIILENLIDAVKGHDNVVEVVINETSFDEAEFKLDSAYVSDDAKCVSVNYDDGKLTVQDVNHPQITISVDLTHYKLPQLVTARLAIYYIVAGVNEINPTRNQNEFDIMMACVKINNEKMPIPQADQPDKGVLSVVIPNVIKTLITRNPT